MASEEAHVGRHPERCHVRSQRVGLGPAVQAGQNRRNPLAQEVFRQRILMDCALDMRMVVDKARRHNEARGLEDLLRKLGGNALCCHPNNPIASNRNISLKTWSTRPIDDRTPADQDIVGDLGQA